MRPIGVSIKASESDGSAMSPALDSGSTGLPTWHSPLPYLFGGMAAMLLLIASSLLILACSYWKFTSAMDRADAEQSDSATAGEDAKTKNKEGSNRPRFVVIMAGDEMPTFMATPRCYRGFDRKDDEEKQGMENMGRMDEGVAKSHDETTTCEVEGANQAVD